MDHPLQCDCGTLRGHVAETHKATRALCYCKDCQAYANALGKAGVLDTYGGTSIVATPPRYVRLTQGLDRLACLSLSPKGLLRWYARCCDTPIANTPRNPKVPYVGLVDRCLVHGAPSLEASFGPVRAVLETASARGYVAGTPLRNGVAILRLVRTMIAAKLTGAHRPTPFFEEAGEPVVAPAVLSREERERATRGG